MAKNSHRISPLVMNVLKERFTFRYHYLGTCKVTFPDQNKTKNNRCLGNIPLIIVLLCNRERLFHEGSCLPGSNVQPCTTGQLCQYIRVPVGILGCLRQVHQFFQPAPSFAKVGAPKPEPGKITTHLQCHLCLLCFDSPFQSGTQVITHACQLLKPYSLMGSTKLVRCFFSKTKIIRQMSVVDL